MAQDSTSKGRSKSAGIGWTAFYTAAVWHELGLPQAHRFVTKRGLFVREVVRFGGGTLGLSGRYSITNLFLAPRHLGLDYLLGELKPVQVIELAAGFSSRGLRWQPEQPEQSRYLEIDQPNVVEYKRELLVKVTTQSNQTVQPILVAADLVQTQGAALVAKLSDYVNPKLPTLIIAEGLTGYMNEKHFRELLRSLGILLDHFEQAELLLDFYLKLTKEKHGRVFWAMWPAQLLWKVGRAPMQMFLQDEKQIRALAESTGFEVTELYAASDLARLIGRPTPPLDLYYVGRLKKVNR